MSDYQFSSNKCCAASFVNMRIPRKLFTKVSGLRRYPISAKRSCGLYDYAAILSLCTSYKDEYGRNLKATTKELCKILGYETEREVYRAVARLDIMGLLKAKLYGDGEHMAIDICGLDKSEMGKKERDAESYAAKNQIGFFFINREIADFLLLNADNVSERDIFMDMCLNTVCNDEKVAMSKYAVFMLREDDTTDVKFTTVQLAAHWKCSVGRVNKVLHQLQKAHLIDLKSFQKLGTSVFLTYLAKLLKIPCVKSSVDKIKALIKSLATKSAGYVNEYKKSIDNLKEIKRSSKIKTVKFYSDNADSARLKMRC